MSSLAVAISDSFGPSGGASVVVIDGIVEVVVVVEGVEVEVVLLDVVVVSGADNSVADTVGATT